jgi:hypothetical protein
LWVNRRAQLSAAAFNWCAVDFLIDTQCQPLADLEAPPVQTDGPAAKGQEKAPRKLESWEKRLLKLIHLQMFAALIMLLEPVIRRLGPPNSSVRTGSRMGDES